MDENIRDECILKRINFAPNHPLFQILEALTEVDGQWIL